MMSSIALTTHCHFLGLALVRLNIRLNKVFRDIDRTLCEKCGHTLTVDTGISRRDTLLMRGQTTRLRLPTCRLLF